MTIPNPLELVLFTHEPALVERARTAGIDSFIVDWEWRGKEERQRGANTEINRDGPAELERLRALGAARRYCRVNRVGPWTVDEIETALASGATDLFVPLVEEPEEVEQVLSIVAARARLGILVETSRGVGAADLLARLPIDGVYVGLNDLAISRRSASIFEALADGTVDRVREAFADVRFGVAGVTVVDGGSPLPASLLLAEISRLGCAFSFLRRSFHREISGRDWTHEVTRIQAQWWTLAQRTPAEVERDRRAFIAACARLSDSSPPEAL